jgi:hypothetical protein
MEKVFNFTNKLEEKRREQKLESYRNRLETLQRIVHCASCHFKCSMCGHHLHEAASTGGPVPDFPGLSLCESCRAEFEDFLRMRRGENDKGVPWHNSEWLELWSVWLDYQRAIGEFRNSDEFRRTVEEMDDQ